MEYNELLCKNCEKNLKYIHEPICKKCGKQLENQEQEYCGDCKKYFHWYDAGIGVFAYNDVIRNSIYEFKYKDMKVYGRFYGEKMAEYAKEYLKVWKPEIIIPVPVSKKKYLKRGYNQAEIIAKVFSEKSGIPYDSKLLYRCRDTRPQKEVSREERKKNLENAFNIIGNVVKYKKIILVDDIYTTGSTIDECARVLKKAGADKVYFISQSIGAGV